MQAGASNQLGITVRQLRAILQAADDVESDSMPLRTATGGSDPTSLEVWLFSEQAEGIVGMIDVDPEGDATELDR